MNVPASKRYTVRFLKNENLEEVLPVLSEMIGFSYQIQRDKVELIKNNKKKLPMKKRNRIVA